jgi:hypothetical protein
MPVFQLISLLVAQNPPTPTPSPSPDVELLKQQLEFLKGANSQLTESFNSFVGALNVSFVVLAIVLGILGAFGAFFYGKTLTEIKQTVGIEVNQQVERIVSEIIKERVDYLQKIVEREEVLSRVTIDYLLPINQGILPPTECQLIKARGFNDVNFRYKTDRFDYRSHVLVLDLVNHQFSEDELISIVRQVVENFASESVLVIYINYRVSALDEFLKNRKVYVVLANSPISLMGTVVNSAYMADALRGGSRS